MPGGVNGFRARVLTLDDDEDDSDHFYSDGLQRPATATGQVGDNGWQERTDDDKEKLEQARLDVELASLDEQIRKLKRLQAEIRSERDLLAATIASRAQSQAPRASKSGGSTASTSSAAAVDYSQSTFPWTAEIAQTAKDIWGIKRWRSGQEGAINATMAGREVVAILPTGGGKSLIFQIPALLAPGTSIVVTPLISLMADQVHGLRSRGIAAEMIHASTSQAEIKDIMARMLGTAAVKGKGKKKVDTVFESEVVKLVYVTPERIEKSKTFVNTLQKMYDAGLLTRFVIDEAHCLSTMGHDYRPAFMSLQRLKVLFPKTPILAVTATAPQNVVSDMLKTLGLPGRTSPGSAALPGTTVVFSAPLYRPNLRYQVLPKPSSAQAALDAIVDWILENHEGETGIIYTLSRADSENIMKGINSHEKSRGRLKAAFYHAYLEDGDKQRVHDQWRDQRVNVVVATNASFGLGIDNPNVRYVVHHSLAKSLANFQQESGRAGRDGAPADCVTFWRAADASRLSSLTYETFHTGGKEKLYEVVRFAEDKRTCRKVLFARYFANAYDSSQAYDANDADMPCGTCDNCVRDPATVSVLDVTEQAYRALRVIEAATAQRGTLTLPQAADLVRGNGGGNFSTQQAKGKGKGKIDVKAVAGNKVTLSKDETEQMLLQLLVDGYLKEEFHATAYNVTSYVHPATKAMRLTRLSPSEFDAANPPTKLEMDVSVSATISRKKRKSDDAVKAPARKKAKKRLNPYDEEDDDGLEHADLGGHRGDQLDVDDMYEEDEDETEAWLQAQEPSSEPDEDGWSAVKTASRFQPAAGARAGAEVLELD
ncbi:hypothetical protein JCM3774_005939 [Rhodotorula dairenensis]